MSKSIEVKITVPFTDDDIEYYIARSGFTTHPWWDEFYNTDNGYGFKVIDPDSREVEWEGTIAFDDIRQAIADIFSLSPRYTAPFRQQFAKGIASGDLDIDSDAADILMQYTVLGKVVFG